MSFIPHFVVLLTILFSYIGKDKKNGLLLSFLPLFFFSALRFNYGNDYVHYYNYFLEIHNSIPKELRTLKPEIGYELLNSLFPSFFLIQTVISSLFISTVYWMIRKNIQNHKLIVLACFLFLINPNSFFIYLSAMRQSIALIFFLYAIYFAYRKKLFMYSLLIIAGSFFHESILILFPIYIIANTKSVNRKLLVLVFLFLLVFLCNQNLLSTILKFGLNLLNSPNYYALFESGLQNSKRATFLTSIYFFYILLSLPHLQGKALFFCKLYLVGLVFGILAYNIAFLTRIQLYFGIIPLHANNI